MVKPEITRAILALPHAHHPRLGAVVEHLSRREGMTVETACELLDGLCEELGISGMDISFSVPGAAPVVKFVPTTFGPGTDYQAGVEAHLHKILKGKQ